jgi:holin-like protein
LSRRLSRHGCAQIVYLWPMRSLLHKPLLGFTVLLLFQWLGEAAVKLAHLPLPGAVLGMFLLFLALLAWGRAPGAVHSAAHSLLSNLSLLFVPAAVGAMLRLSGLLDWGLAFVALIVLSTLVTLAVTGGLLQFFTHREQRHG